jgi:translation initiation factor 3 subunit L
VKVVEATVGRRYAGWFLKNAEHAARVYTQVKNGVLPVSPVAGQANLNGNSTGNSGGPQSGRKQGGGGGGKDGRDGRDGKEGRKVAWAGTR